MDMSLYIIVIAVMPVNIIWFKNYTRLTLCDSSMFYWHDVHETTIYVHCTHDTLWKLRRAIFHATELPQFVGPQRAEHKFICKP